MKEALIQNAVSTGLLISLSVLTLIALAFLVRTFSRRQSVLKWLTLTLCFFLIGYVVCSVPLFVLDVFTVLNTLCLELVVCLLWLGIRFLRSRKKEGKWLSELDWDLKPCLIPLALVLVALILSWGNNGYFGMGQDQGVYQVKAIDLMYGKTSRIYYLEEYNQLETPEEKAFYYEKAVESFQGLNIGITEDERSALPAFINPDLNAEYTGVYAVYHGLPTYPALLALWGLLFGLEAMAGVQTLIFILTVLMLWLVAEQLEMKKTVALLVCAVFLLSPEIVWLSKSTLTEGFLALIMAVFLYFLLNKENPERRWASAWMVAVFSVFHVSIYVMIPMFLVLYWLLYLYTGDRQYLRGGVISSLGFILGFTFMVFVSSHYTLTNTARIWMGPINIRTIYPILMAAGLLGLIVSVLLRWVKVKGGFKAFIQSKGFSWILRVLILALLALSVRASLRLIPEEGFEAAVRTNSLYDLVWMAGLLSVPVVLLELLIRPRRALENENGAALTFLFGYAVLAVCCLLMPQVLYCYYFGRYLGPYLPVVLVFAGLFWNRYAGWKPVAALAAAVICLLPFDGTMLIQQDDSRASYNSILRFAEAVGGERSAVIYGWANMHMLPVRAIGKADGYFAEADVEAQAERLSQRYDEVYCVPLTELDWEPVLKVDEPVVMDDNASFRLPFCPFPYAFASTGGGLTVYRYTGTRTFTGRDLSVRGGNPDPDPEGRRITLETDQMQTGPYISLTPGAYRVTYQGTGLEGLDVKVTSDNGAARVPSVTDQQTGETVSYSFVLYTPVSGVEFVAYNGGMDAAVIEKVTLHRNEIEQSQGSWLSELNWLPDAERVLLAFDDPEEKRWLKEQLSDKWVLSSGDQGAEGCDMIFAHTPFETLVSKHDYHLAMKKDFYLVYLKNGFRDDLVVPQEEISFTYDKNSAEDLLQQIDLIGFSDWKKQGRWTTQENAEIRFAFLNQADYEITIRPKESYKGFEDGFEMVFEWNGQEIYRTVLTQETKKNPVTFTVPADRIDPDAFVQTLTIRTPLWTSSKYPEPVGYNLGSITIREIH